MAPTVSEAALPPKRKAKAYHVLGDVTEFQERLAATLPPPKAPEPESVLNTPDSNEFPQEVWFAATISPDNGVAIIASYRELCKARALYQQQLANIHTARKHHGMVSAAAGAAGTALQLRGGTLVLEPPVNRTITESVRFGAETRKLGKFEQHQNKWDDVTANLAARLGRAPHELAMQRGPAWRTRAELTELLYRAQPRDMLSLHPDDVWTMSLRDAWERIIPLGSIFSGLAIRIKEKPGELPPTRAARIGRPLDPLTATRAAPAPPGELLTATGALMKPPLGRSLSARGRAWEDSEVLRQRVNEYGNRLRALAPHDPDFGALVVAGEALEGQLEALATAPISLAEVEAHVRSHAPEAFEAYRAIKDEMEAQLRAALEAEEAARAAAEEAARARAPQPGPHVRASASGLSLSCHTGETASSTVTLTSCGTAAVWWTWEKRPAAQHAHAVTELAQPSRFVASQQSGMLLPGQSLELTVTFVPAVAGTFRETWELVTRPPLQGPGSRLALQLRGAAEVRDESGSGRADMEARLAEREKVAKVAAALERILRDVRMPRRPVPPEPADEAAAADAWDRANGCSVSEGAGVEGGGPGPYAWPPLFHSAPVQAELAAVYAEALGVYNTVVAPTATDDAKKKKKEGGAKKGGDDAPAAQPKYPATWSGSLALLDGLLAELAAAAPGSAVAPLAARAEAAKARARVPPSSRKVLRRAMRCLVGKLVDLVDDKLGAIRVDMEAKAAAEAAAAGGGEGEGGELAAEESTASAPAADKAHGKAKSGKGGAKGGKGRGATAAAAAAAAADSAAAAPGSGLPSVEHLQPAFHEKAVPAAKAAIKVTLNTLLDEVHRHKVAVGDALEASIRSLDERIAAEQQRHLAEAADGVASSVPAATAAALAAPADGVPAPGPGPAAPVRSPALEELYWERLAVLRTWTSLGVPNRADIR